MATASSILASFQASQASANRANLARYKEGIAIYDDVIARYGKEGGFVKGQTAQLERTKTKDVASGMQNLVSSGLAGSTMAGGLGKAWEEDVGAPTRLSIADIAGQRMTQAQMGKTGFIERREDTGPDAALISQLMQLLGQGSGGGGRTSYSAPQLQSTRPSAYPSTAASWGSSQPSISSAGRRAPTYTPPTGTQLGSTYYGSAYKAPDYSKPGSSTWGSEYAKKGLPNIQTLKTYSPFAGKPKATSGGVLSNFVSDLWAGITGK